MAENGKLEESVWQDPELVKTFLEGVQAGIPYAQDQISIALRVLAQLGRPVDRFVDLGSGDGKLARAVSSQYPDAQGVLVDFSEQMLDHAREQMDANKTQFITADLSDPGWREELVSVDRLDAVVSRYAIHHLSNDRKQALYQEIYDLLAPGGVFLNIEHVSSVSETVEELSNQLFVDSIYGWHQETGSDKSRETVASDFVYRDDKKANILVSVDLQIEWLRRAGFEDADCYFKVFELAVFGGRKPA